MSSNEHTHGAAATAGHGSLKDYLIGFMASVVLTLIPFWLVIGKVFETKTATVSWILGLGFVQMIFHLAYFLHLKPSLQKGWTLTALVLAFIVIVICLIGSIWVVQSLHHNMIPMLMEPAVQ
jgi:cytochrome o ubiquinol oxidase operon protein cyoD